MPKLQSIIIIYMIQVVARKVPVINDQYPVQSVEANVSDCHIRIVQLALLPHFALLYGHGVCSHHVLPKAPLLYDNQTPPPPHHHLYSPPNQGPLMGDLQCRMSILRNGNVASPYRLFFLVSHVEFKKRLCPMSL